MILTFELCWCEQFVRQSFTLLCVQSDSVLLTLKWKIICKQWKNPEELLVSTAPHSGNFANISISEVFPGEPPWFLFYIITIDKNIIQIHVRVKHQADFERKQLVWQAKTSSSTLLLLFFVTLVLECLVKLFVNSEKNFDLCLEFFYKQLQFISALYQFAKLFKVKLNKSHHRLTKKIKCS